jgi:hypothetical protein
LIKESFSTPLTIPLSSAWYKNSCINPLALSASAEIIAAGSFASDMYSALASTSRDAQKPRVRFGSSARRPIRAYDRIQYGAVQTKGGRGCSIVPRAAPNAARERCHCDSDNEDRDQAFSSCPVRPSPGGRTEARCRRLPRTIPPRRPSARAASRGRPSDGRPVRPGSRLGVPWPAR